MTDWSDVEFFAAPLRTRKSKDFLPILSSFLVVWDIFACGMAGSAALLLYSRFVLKLTVPFWTFGPFHHDVALGSVIVALILRTSGADLDPRLHNTWRLIWSAERNCLISFAILISIGVMTRATDDLARLWLVAWLLIFAATVACSRAVLGQYLHRLQRRGGLRETVAIIGAAGTRERMASRIADEADVVGMFAARTADDDLDDDQDDDLKHLLDLGREGALDSVILALDYGCDEAWKHVVERLKMLPIQVAVCPDNGWSQGAVPRMRVLGGMPMTVVAERPIKQWDLFVKTILDKVGALLLLVLLAPLLLGIAMAVAATSPGPVIFRQQRRGWCGNQFVIFKFRTMQSDSGGRPMQTTRHDPRCTSVGRVLRRSSLDELPQLWNVLRGDMSLVGPRPHAEMLHDLDRAGREIVAEYAQRHRVKPGLTGWAQVNGARGATASLAQLRRRVELDLYYIENWSLALDIEILLRTPLSMVGDGAF